VTSNFRFKAVVFFSASRAMVSFTR
jgi:hypothetical protein